MAGSGKKASNSLSSTISHACAEDFDLFCQPCDLDDVRQEAFWYCVDCEIHLCESCFNTHRRPRPLRHHTLLNKDDLPKYQAGSTKPTLSAASYDLTEPCVNVNKDMITSYCNEHKTMLCSVCMVLEHTHKSCHMADIPDVSSCTVDSSEVIDALQELEKVNKKCQKITSSLLYEIKTPNTSLDASLADIDKFTEDVNQRLAELEMESTNAPKSMKQENDTKLESTKSVFYEVAKSSKVEYPTSETKKEDKLCTEIKQAKEIIMDTVVTSNIPQSEDIKDKSFSTLKATQLRLNKKASLGTKTDKTSAMSPSSSGKAPLRTWTSRSNGIFDVKTNESDCMISDIIILDSSHLLLIDRLNEDMKVVNTKSYTVSYQRRIGIALHSGTALPGGEFAVTTMYWGLIFLFTFSSEEIQDKTYFKVHGMCCGISYNQERLAVTYRFPGKLQIMDMNGKVQTTVKHSSSNDPLLSHPEYICSTDSEIYVSDPGMHSVIWLNWQGQLIGRFEGLGSPKGIAILDDGSFIVSDMSKSNIFNITADCKESKIVKYSNSTRALCWCEATKTIYVSSYSDSRNSQNFIQFYKMK